MTTQGAHLKGRPEGFEGVIDLDWCVLCVVLEMLKDLIGQHIDVLLSICFGWQAGPVIIEKIIDLLAESIRCALLGEGILNRFEISPEFV